MCAKFCEFNFRQCCLPMKISSQRKFLHLQYNITKYTQKKEQIKVATSVNELSASKSGYCTMSLHESNVDDHIKPSARCSQAPWLGSLCWKYMSVARILERWFYATKDNIGNIWWRHKGRSLFVTTFVASRWWSLMILKLNATTAFYWKMLAVLWFIIGGSAVDCLRCCH